MQSRYRRRIDRDGKPLGPIPKANETVEVPLALSADAERTLSEVAAWARQGRSSRAEPLSGLIDHGDWIPPNIRLSRAKRSLAWWKLCCLHAAAAHRDQLDDLHALLLHIEGASEEEADPLALLRGIDLAAALIRATAGRERRFVRQHRLDEPRPDEIEEQQQEAG